jgi:hypothetical protein
MKKILIVFTLCGLLLSTGCEDFLDTTNYTAKDTSNYPANEAEMNDLVTGVYAAAMLMEKQSETNCLWMINEIMSDDRFGGGGVNDVDWRFVEEFAIVKRDFLAGAWEKAYQTIYRANVVLAQLDMIEWSSEDARNYVEGQARFFRADAFFYLARLFGTAPMPVSPEPKDLPRASADELFAQIALDFSIAAEKMPATKWQDINKKEDRTRATRWAAGAFMARAFLFYTGYYGKDAIDLTPAGGEGSIDKATVVKYLEDCIQNSGHDLLPDFRNLWPYGNSVTNASGNGEFVYEYAVENSLEWIGEEGDNYETVFAFSSAPTYSSWSVTNGSSYGNPIVLYCSPRTPAEGATDKDYYPFGFGWGFGPVNPDLWNKWPSEDPRKEASILSSFNSKEISTYVWSADSQMNESGYWNKKYTRILAPNAGGTLVNYGIMLWGEFVPNDMQLGNVQDLVTMRFADVLLMHSELTGTADGMNRVRARVGLPEIPYSVEALRAERRYELAFEGVRYYDLLRYGMDYAANALAAQNGIAVQNQGVAATMNLDPGGAKLKATGGFMPIPGAQIDLSSVLEQTPGWETLK